LKPAGGYSGVHCAWQPESEEQRVPSGQVIVAHGSLQLAAVCGAGQLGE
jgi:hypothetical protein